MEHHRKVFKKLGFLVAQPTIIREGNKACQLFAVYAGSYSKTKHLIVRYPFVRERIQRGSVRVDNVPTSNKAQVLYKVQRVGTTEL